MESDIKVEKKKMIQPFTGLKTKLLAISLALPESRTCVPSISIWPQRNVPDIASVILPSLESHPGLIVNSIPSPATRPGMQQLHCIQFCPQNIFTICRNR